MKREGNGLRLSALPKAGNEPENLLRPCNAARRAEGRDSPAFHQNSRLDCKAPGNVSGRSPDSGRELLPGDSGA